MYTTIDNDMAQVLRDEAIMRAKSYLDGYAYDFAIDHYSEDGYMQDDIGMFADSATSVYIYDNIRYCIDHERSSRDVVDEGLALSPHDFFAPCDGKDFSDYLAHVGACAEYYDVERAIYDDRYLVPCMAYLRAVDYCLDCLSADIITADSVLACADNAFQSIGPYDYDYDAIVAAVEDAVRSVFANDNELEAAC